MAPSRHYSVLVNGVEVYHGAIRSCEIIYNALFSAFSVLKLSPMPVVSISFTL